MKCTLTHINCRHNYVEYHFNYIYNAQKRLCDILCREHEKGHKIVYAGDAYHVVIGNGVKHRISTYFIWRIENNKTITYRLTRRQEIRAWVK